MRTVFFGERLASLKELDFDLGSSSRTCFDEASVWRFWRAYERPKPCWL